MGLPDVLGKYELVEPLATGGMAELHLARARGPAGVRKTVVIKRIRPEFTEDPRFVGWFINEARIGMQLNHPNIVQVYDLGRAQGTWFMAMEHVHGRDLMKVQRVLRGMQVTMPIHLAVTVVAELLRGLHHAHTRSTNDGRPLGLVHHDVSPHNVLLGFDGQVKLVDFGIARIHHEGPSTGDSGTPAGRGKQAYRSPESSQPAADLRADLYASGVVLWELLRGQRPHADLPAEERAVALAEGVPSLEVDPELDRIVARATSSDPAARHGSAAAFEEDLRAWLYEAEARVTSSDIGTWMRGLFPDAVAPRSTFDAELLAEDLERLETEAAPISMTLPGKLQTSPGERKHVAVLVVDVDGLTQLSAELDPERFVARHYRLLRWVRRIVDRWGGVLQRAIDDHLVILFGVPRTREDDVSRALDCALDLLRTREELKTKGLSLEFCIGVHAGEVTVAMARRRVNYLARGNTTRLARRLSASADHGEILVSRRVLSQMEADFRLRQGPSIPSRGGGAPLPSYLLEARRAGVRLTQRGPWLRRGQEVEVLRRHLERLAEGSGTGLALVGPVGTGKSRLIREVEHLALRRNIAFQGVRLAVFGNVFAPLVHALIGVDGDHSAADRISSSGFSTQHQSTLRWLVGLPSPSPERGDVPRALVHLVRRLSDEPVILAIECEGVEVSALNTLASLIERTADLPVLYLLASRPPMAPRLAEVVERVELGPFSREAQEKLLASLLEVDTIDVALMGLVTRTCEGNVLYLQEMAKFLLERGSLVVEGNRAVLAEAPDELPGTLQALIAARIDVLDAASKGVLQLASVIGHDFSGALLGRAAGLEDPTPLLMELEACGLVVRGERGWSFATRLVRDAAGKGILGVQRRDYHRLVSEALEDLHADDLEPVVEALSRHCAKGGRWVDGARYALRAGERLERAGRLGEARERYEAGLRFISKATDPESHDARVQGEAALNLKSGSVSLLLGELRRGRGALTLALDIAGDAGLPWIENRAHLKLGTSFLHEGRARLAAAHLGQAVAMAIDEPEVELEALEATATLALDQGKYDEAERVWQQVLDRAEGQPRLTARCLTGLATQFMRTGDAAKADPMLHRALEAARAAEDSILEGRVLNNIGLHHSIGGDHEAALGWYRQALDAREGIGYSRGVAINHHNIGDAHFHMEQWARAHVAFQRSRELAEQTGWRKGMVLNDVFLAYLDARRGREVESGVQHLDRLHAEAVALDDPQIAVTTRWIQGKLLVEVGQMDRGSRVLAEALETANSLRLVPEATRIQRAMP